MFCIYLPQPHPQLLQLPVQTPFFFCLIRLQIIPITNASNTADTTHVPKLIPAPVIIFPTRVTIKAIT